MEVQSSRTVSEAGSEKTTAEEEEEEKRRRRPWMKAAQLLEFQMQAMVYRYIAAGLPVPHHLVVPIWNSFALSSWSNHFIRNHHSSSSSSSQFAELSSKRLYHMDMVDPEPTRCRRTDGKKWRCSSNVVTFQKYCERHMHRGRKRSRKLVESYEVDSSTSGVVSIKRENNDGLEGTQSQSVLPGGMSNSSNAQVVTIASFAGENAREDVVEAVTCPALVISESTNRNKSYSTKSRSNVEISTRVRVVPEVEFLPKNVQGDERLPCVRKEWRSGENGPFGRSLFPEHLSRGSEVSDLSLQAARFSGNRKNRIVARSMEWKNMKVNGGLCPTMHFSPDTVLQGHGGCGVNRVETCNEPGRCRRTDGKKWRCSKDALPGQKYCTKHMHRGIKKRSDEKASSSIPSTIAKSGYCEDGDDYITSQNLKLSVSVMENPISRVSKEMSSSSCSTDTTITDTALRGEENEDFSLCSGV